tara:strand:+ start:3385 stop:3654 length:270 start_codon:yes stop_codon:yes gene_type:complete
MPRTALVWRDGEQNKIVSIDEDLTAPNDEHFVLELPDDVEPWRFSVNDDEELVVAYDGEDADTALASLLADQEQQIADEEAAVIASRGE